MNPKSLANLRPVFWKPGQSGNPKGVPRARVNLYRYICEYMEMTPKQLKKLKHDELTMSQRAALKTALIMADEGEWQRIKEMIDRNEGKVPDVIEANIGMSNTEAMAIIEKMRNK